MKSLIHILLCCALGVLSSCHRLSPQLQASPLREKRNTVLIQRTSSHWVIRPANHQNSQALFSAVSVRMPLEAAQQVQRIRLSAFGSLDTSLFRQAVGSRVMMAASASVLIEHESSTQLPRSTLLSLPVDKKVNAQVSKSELGLKLMSVSLQPEGSSAMAKVTAVDPNRPIIDMAVSSVGIYQLLWMDEKVTEGKIQLIQPQKPHSSLSDSQKEKWVPLSFTRLVSAELAIAVEPNSNGYCSTWGSSQSAGSFDPKVLPEASGLAYSTDFDRLYLINDSGSAPQVIVTQTNGQITQIVDLKDFEARDLEAISLGRCPTEEKKCLFVMDIGNNVRADRIYQIGILDEHSLRPKTKPKHVVQFRYPGEPRDAEAAVVLPNGDVLIVTKQFSPGYSKFEYYTEFYRIARRSLASSKHPVVANFEGRINLLQMISPGYTLLTALALRRHFEFPWFLPSIHPKWEGYKEILPLFSKTVTDATLVPDGIVLLTYGVAIHLRLNLEPFEIPKVMLAGSNYENILLDTQFQQEAIAFVPQQNQLLYTHEYVPPYTSGVSLQSVHCLQTLSGS